MVGPALQPVAAGVQVVVAALAAVVEAFVEAVALGVEAVGALLATAGVGRGRAMVEAFVDAVAPGVQASFGVVTAGVEALVDAVAAGFPTVGDGAGRVRGSGGYTDEEGCGQGEVGEAAGGGGMTHGGAPG